MSRRRPPSGPGGLIVVDKPPGMTSHDVVARIRRIVGTRRVGHAGTLDPMATGVLIVGVERATKLLSHLVLTDKTYLATIRLGQATTTDDFEGQPLRACDATGVELPSIEAGLRSLTGQILQRPSAVSAIKVDGRRAYDLVRAGEIPELAPRPVTVYRLALLGPPRPAGSQLDLDVEVACSSGTYVRALARDLGEGLGVGGHLTALRRTQVGAFDLSRAVTLPELELRDNPVTLPLPVAIASAMKIRTVSAEEARELSYGRTIQPIDLPGTYGAIDENGAAVALVSERDGRARPVLGFTPAG